MQRIYNSVEDVNKFYGVDLKLPNNIPEGCNAICYRIESLYNLRAFEFYRESEGTLYYFSNNNWCSVWNSNLDDEVAYDIKYEFDDLIYLRLGEKKDKFSPTFLLGVETTEGFITKINRDIKGFVNIGYTTCDPRELKYYISDDNDETVSFDEYVKLFYDAEGVL